MNRNKIIGFALALVLFVVFFNYAFIEASVDKPMVQLLAFVGLLVSMVVCGFLTNGTKEEGGH